MLELDSVCIVFYEAIDGYEWLLRKVFATTDRMGLALACDRGID